jgi:amino acid efflux transporter
MEKSEHGLKKGINVPSLVAYYFTTVVGVGIFIVPLHTLKVAGPASIISWILVLLMAYPLALTFARISEKYPVSGSIAAFIADAFGKRVGAAFGIFIIASTLVGNCLLGLTAARLLHNLIGFDPSLIMPISLGFLLLSCGFNLLGVEVSGKIQMLALAVLVIIIELVVVFSLPQANVENAIPFMPDGFSSIGAAIIICFYAVTGWENVGEIAEEVVDPKNSYNKAIKWALLLIGTFYLSLVVAVVLLLPRESIDENSMILSALLTKAGYGQVASLGDLISIALLVLGANAWVLGTSRLILSIARTGALPQSLAKLNSKGRPTMAVIMQIPFYVVAIIIMAFAAIDETTVIEVSSLNYMLAYALIFIGAIKKFEAGPIRRLALFSLAIILVLLPHSLAPLAYSATVAIMCGTYVILNTKIHKP